MLDRLSRNQVEKSVRQVSKILPYSKPALCYSDIVTQLTPGDASLMSTIESFAIHDENGDISMEIDDDSRDGTAGMHNG